MLITFLGLISASVLPTVSLCIGSMSSTGRSVRGVDDLFASLQSATQTLFSTLAWVAISVASILLLSVIPKIDVPFAISETLFMIDDLPRRATQSLAFACSARAVLRSLAIPNLLLLVLTRKREIAIFEAREKLRLNAPSDLEVKQMFPKKEGFGATVRAEK